MTWTIESGGVEKSLAAWGIRDVTVFRQSRTPDAMTFAVDADVDDDPLFEDGDTVVLKRDGVRWFEGRVADSEDTFDIHEAQGFVVLGPWRSLTRMVFQQEWKYRSNPFDGESSLASVFKSALLLNVRSDGVQVSIGEQIRVVLQYAVDNGAPFQIGTISLPNLIPPTSSVSDRMCSEVIDGQLRWAPDAVTWFDYTTSPPTLHVKQRSALVAVTLGDGDGVKVARLKPRRDMQVPAVVIKYDRVNEVNGQGLLQQFVDKYPTDASGTAEGTLIATVNLEGDRSTYGTAELVCAAINAESATTETKLAWWKGREEWMLDPAVVVASVDNVTYEPALAPGMVYEVTDGMAPPWISGNGVLLAETTISADVTFTHKTGPDVELSETANILKRATQRVTTKVRATNTAGGTFRSLLSYTSGESVPTGIAQHLYTAASVLHHEGAVTLDESEVTGAVGVGNLLNIADAKPAWATMGATVQSVREQIDTGQTTISVGPPSQKGLGDLIALLGVNRFRLRTDNPAALATGKVITGGALAAGKSGARERSSSGPEKLKRMMLTNGTTTIEIDADMAGGRPMFIREVTICEDQPNGTSRERKMRILASAVYD